MIKKTTLGIIYSSAVATIATALMAIYHLRPTCWVCNRRLTRREAGVHRSGIPFDAPYTLEVCDNCYRHRATSGSFAIWHLRRWSLGTTPLDIDAIMHEMDMLEKDQRTIHVLNADGYIPMRQWIGTPDYDRAVAEYQPAWISRS